MSTCTPTPRQFAKRMKNTQVYAAWQQWHGLFVMMRRVKVVIGRVRNRALHGAFAKWEEMCEEAARMRGKGDAASSTPGAFF